MSNRVGEEFELFNEVVGIASGTSAITNGYSMANCEEITFVVGMGTAAGAATAISPTVTVRQSADSLLSTSATVAGLSTIIGPTTAERLVNVKSALITMTTAATGAQTVIVNNTTWTFSTVPATTSFTFGSSVGATAATGLDLAMNSLSSAINASTAAQLQGLTASTVSTAAIRIRVNNTASTDLSLTGVAGAYALTAEKNQVIMSVKAEDLNSTSAYVGIGITTAATAVSMGVCVIKKGMRYKEPNQITRSNLKST